MADKLALPLLLPNPPPSKSIFQDSHPHFSNSTTQPLAPFLNDLFHQQNPNTFPNFPSTSTSTSNSTQIPQSPIYPSPIPRTRRRIIGKEHDTNRGKPWYPHRLSSHGEKTLQTLIDPEFQLHNINQILLSLYTEHRLESSELDTESLSFDILGIIKGLGYYKKCDLALNVFEWARNRPDSGVLLNGSIIAVVISMLGKEGRISVASSLLHNLHKDGFGIDVYAYTSLITAFARNGRYRDAVKQKG